MTTIPSKFDEIHMSIDSLLNQTLPPEKIILHIANKYSLRFNEQEIPHEKIEAFRAKYEGKNVYVNLVEKDYGPGTKLLGLFHLNDPALQLNYEDPENFVVLVDDDLMYQPYMLEDFNNYVNRHHKCCVGSYYCCSLNHFIVGQGADGFFIRQHLLTYFMDYYRIIEDCDFVHYHDDVFISYYFYLRNVNIHWLAAPYNKIIYTMTKISHVDGLHTLKNEKYNRENLNRVVPLILHRLKEENRFEHIPKYTVI